MILKNVIRDVIGSGAVVEREWGDSGVKWSSSGAGVGNEWGMSGEFFYFILQFLKIKTKEFSFRMVFNKFSTYKYIQYTNTYKYSFQHFNIVFNKFSTFQQHHNNFPTSFQQVFNKLSTYQKLLFLKINFYTKNYCF